MDHDSEKNQERLDVLLALKSLLEFAKLNADDIAAQGLADAIEDAKSEASRSIEDLQR